jgi:hypothetical protein
LDDIEWRQELEADAWASEVGPWCEVEPSSCLFNPECDLTPIMTRHLQEEQTLAMEVDQGPPTTTVAPSHPFTSPATNPPSEMSATNGYGQHASALVQDWWHTDGIRTPGTL